MKLLKVLLPAYLILAIAAFLLVFMSTQAGSNYKIFNTSHVSPPPLYTFTDYHGRPTRLLSYGSYCIIANYLESDLSLSLNNHERITLVLHLSIDYFDQSIVDQVKGWDGPLSLAILLYPNEVFKQIEKIQKTILQYENAIRPQLSVHLFFKSVKSCDLFTVHSISPLQPSNTGDATFEPYPLSRTKYILLTDYEFISSYGFEKNMLTLAEQYLARDNKAVLVFRIFEALGSMSTVPRNKSNLYEMYKAGTAVEFHRRYTGNAHSIAGLNYWFMHNRTDEPKIDRIIKYSRRNWEPQFVSLTTIPFHDENFPYSIRDNTVLRWEMCRMNYTFVLVHDHFTVHPRIKRSDPQIERQKRLVRNQFNKALADFKMRMYKLYPETLQSCPSPGP